MTDPRRLDPVQITVEVVYAEPERAIRRSYRLSAPARLDDALQLAAGDPEFSDIDLASATIGIHGRLVAPAQPLEEGDRVEIYRPLAADPKAARRARAEQARRRQ